LQTVFPTARQFGGPGKFGFDPSSFLDENSPLSTPENARKLFHEWSRYWDLNASLLLEKSPPNIVRSRFFQAMFPRSHFIVILRHPLAVSLATAKWSKTPIESLVEHWLICYNRFFADMEYLKSCRIVRYEEFVLDPERELDRIYSFLQVCHSDSAHEVYADVNEKYFSRWSVFSREQANLESVERLIGRYEDKVNKYGYSLVDLHKLLALKV